MNKKSQSPAVWNAIKKKKVKAKKKSAKRKFDKGKLTFFSITSGAGDLDFLFSNKMLKARKKSAKELHGQAKKYFRKVKKNLANVGKKNKSTKSIKQLEKKLVVAKMLKAQSKDFYRLAKADYKKFKK